MLATPTHPGSGPIYQKGRRPSARWKFLVAVVGGFLFAAPVHADDAAANAEAVQYFEGKVRPLLVQHCHKCHGPDEQKSGLRLDSRAAALAGGDTGPAVVPGKPKESLLVEAINYASFEMPPSRKLAQAEIDILTRWVQDGAAWPETNVTGAIPVRKPHLAVTDEDRQFWSFRPVVRPPLPAIDSGATPVNPIDALIWARLEEKGLRPSPFASRRELIRRAYFDLIGLPPKPEEIEAFAADESPEAYERLIDRLLSLPRYGERWGRHWLDVVRFAQTNGYERDGEKPEAWRYRDYVIRALNADKPYDQFLREQLAGDELDQVTDDSLTATGFYRLGVWDDEPDDRRQAEYDELDDILSTAGSAMLGLTIGCARCHDHKFDPIPQEDYYRLLAFVRNVSGYGKPKDNSGGTQADDGIFRVLSTGQKTLAVSEYGPMARETHVLARGSAALAGKEVEPAFPQVLCAAAEQTAPSIQPLANSPKTTGRRRALADWVASPENPLTARVIVNRLWHHHFGRGIVATPNDFGHTGLAPTHPQLLDYLASELIAGGWKLKALHKKIMLSATYRQSSRAENEAAVAVDPGNTLLWRQNLRRLDAESIRDAVLATSGRLNLAMGGRGIFPTLSAEVLSTQSRPGNGWDNTPAAEQGRRSVYIFVKRTLGVPLLETFDGASPDTSTPARTTTTIAPQALVLLNSSFMDEQSTAFAQRVLAEAQAEKDPTEENLSVRLVRRAYRLALGREPREHELQIAAGYLQKHQAAWSELAAAGAIPKTAPAAAPSTRLAGWSNFGGSWSLREDGGYQVEAALGAKAIWDGVTMGDGTVQARLWMGQGLGDAGLILRVKDPQLGTDALTAYNVNLKSGKLRLGKHQNNWKELVAVPADVAAHRWQEVRVDLTGPRIRIYLGDSEEPAIDYTDPAPLPAGGVGFRAYQVQAAVRDLQVATSDKKQVAAFKPLAAEAASTADRPDTAEPAAPAASDEALAQALASLCKVILNLNEFVYID